MRRTLTEESILFASVIKWIALASCTGVIVGAAGSGFLWLLAAAIRVADSCRYAFLLLPLAFFVSALLTTYLAPDAEGHGTEKVIEAIHRHGSVIPIAVVPVKLLATVITIAIGGSAGKEGPCAQIGAGLSSLFARILRCDEKDRRKLVICGISAGFATVFGTPIAGAIFGVEVLIVGSLLYDVLLPSFVAGVIACQVSSFFGVPYLHPAPILVPAVSAALLLKVIGASIVFGLVAMLLIKGMQAGHRLSGALRLWRPVKGIIAGCLLVLLSMVFGTRYLGLGVPTIEACLNGQGVPWYAPLLKILFTSVTLNGGGSGGIVTPIFFIGSTAGAALAGLLRVDSALLAAIGFVCLLAGAANTPIAASIMAVEMFGPSVGPYAAVACVISYLMTGYRSVYPSQILGVQKSSSIDAPLGREMQDVRASYHRRGGTVTGAVVGLWRRMTGAGGRPIKGSESTGP